MATFNNHIYKEQNSKNPFEDKKQLLKNRHINTIFDIGANKGQSFSKYSIYFPDSLIYCFEPFETSYNILLENHTSNPHIKPHRVAVSDQTGISDFFVNHKSIANSLLPVTNEGKFWADKPKDVKPVEQISIETITIDDFCINNVIDEIQIVKLDIQGSELLALKGAKNFLSQGKILLIYAEIIFPPIYSNGTNLFEIGCFLKDYNYELFDIYNIIYAGNNMLKRCDALFISPEIRNEIFSSLSSNISEAYGKDTFLQ